MNLKEKISKSGLTVTWVARKLGISREGLHKKLRGNSEFKASEIATMSKILNLTNDEIREYFFYQNK